MDTSKQYIKMCDCPEIQGQKPKGNEFTISYKNPDIWIEHEGSFLYAKHDIWLPRQDQIQEMLPLYDHPSTLAVFFGVFCANKEMYEGVYAKKGYGFVDKFISMEQLWLAFYMYEKHKKTWDGKKWVEEKEKE